MVTPAKKRIIGTDSRNYNPQKNFRVLPLQNYEFKEVRDIYKILNWLSFKIQNKNPLEFLNSFRDFDINGVDLFHFFNGISYGKKPWVTTFESALPRWGDVSDRKKEQGLRLLAGKPCKQLIGFSECSKNIQKDYIQSFFPAFADDILPKLSFLHPTQKPAIQSITEKNPPKDFIRFVLVGADFFRKGGLETLHVFDRMIAAGAPLQLVIISKMDAGDYATHAGAEEKAEAMKLISKHPNQITWHKQLPNQDVIKLLRDSHIGLLPTWADTYGYSILEAQSAGCAVLSTDIRVMPEINTTETGWVISVKKDSWGDAILRNDSDRRSFSQHLESKLEETLQEIISDPTSIIVKGQAGFERIKKYHNPALRAIEMESVYDAALK